MWARRSSSDVLFAGPVCVRPEVFEPWLYRLTVTRRMDYLRRQRRRNESRMSDLSEQQVMMADAAAALSRRGVAAPLQ